MCCGMRMFPCDSAVTGFKDSHWGSLGWLVRVPRPPWLIYLSVSRSTWEHHRVGQCGSLQAPVFLLLRMSHDLYCRQTRRRLHQEIPGRPDPTAGELPDPASPVAPGDPQGQSEHLSECASVHACIHAHVQGRRCSTSDAWSCSE